MHNLILSCTVFKPTVLGRARLCHSVASVCRR